MSTSGTPVTVPVTVTAFRTDFPEFANTAVFPDTMVAYWLNLAALLLTSRWGQQLGTGIELFCAHNCVLEAYNTQGVNAGGLPGLTKGVVSAESAGSVSVNYDTASALDPKAEHWNMTNYGTRFWFLARMMGAGPIHLSGCGSGSSPFSGGVLGPGIGGQF